MPNSMKLLTQRRFLPFFVVQFLGAFNDNLYKNALLVLLALEISSSKTLSFYTNISMALFIAPMFIFSAWSGLLAERMEKSRLIIKLKYLELIIALLATSALLLGNYVLMIVVLMLFGLQSAFFGPTKYGLLPERLQTHELMAGNGIVEAGTFLAILLGTLSGSYLVAVDKLRLLLFAIMLLAAIIGLFCAYFIPSRSMPSNQAGLPKFKPWQQTKELLSKAYGYKTIFQSILAISWFWLLGGALLTQLPQFSKEILGGDKSVITYLLVLFSVGVGLGSLSSNLIAKGRVEAGLVPIGAFMMAFFLYQIIQIETLTGIQSLRGLADFYKDTRFWSVSMAFGGLAFAGGMYVVPLYALIQTHAPSGYKSQMIAANNIINALFLVLISVASIVVLSVLGLSLQQLFAMILGLHIIVAIYIFTVVPEFIFRLAVMFITTFLYRVRVKGKHHQPKTGAAIYICNHISYVDALIIMAKIRRPIRFIMYYKIFSVPVLRWLFKAANAIPIASRRENETIYHQAMQEIDKALKNGEIIGIFPEGKITTDGQLSTFKPGVEIMLKNNPVPVIPMALDNLWGSFFSRQGGLFKGYPRKWLAKISLTIGEPLAPETSVATMQQVVSELKQQAQQARAKHQT